MTRRRSTGSRHSRRARALLVAIALAAVSGCASDNPGPAPVSAATRPDRVDTERLHIQRLHTQRLDTVRRIMAPSGEVRQFGAPDTDAVVLAHPAQEATAERLAAELPAALSAVAEFWDPGDTAWTRRAVVAVASDRAEFAALLRAPAPAPGESGTDPVLSSDVAAAAYSDPFRFGTPPTGQRVVFAPDAGSRLDPDHLRTVLRHELTHLATRAHTGASAPHWLVEGFADYAAHRGLDHAFTEIAPTVRASARAGRLPADLPGDPAFAGPAAVESYEQAWTICAFVAATHGEPRLLRLYRALAAGASADEDRVLREVLGTGRSDFVEGWRTWLAERSD